MIKKILLTLALLFGFFSHSEAAIAIRSETTGSGTTNASNGTFTVTAPSTIVNNDYVVIVVGKTAASVGSAVACSGFTTGNELTTTTGNDVYGGIFYKKASSESGDYSCD